MTIKENVLSTDQNTPAGPAGRRAKFVFSSDSLHRLLGLPDTIRVVAVDVRNDPLRVDIRVEGDDLPAMDRADLGSFTELAYLDIQESPILLHPTMTHRVQYGDWTPGKPIDDPAAELAETP